MKTVFRVHLPVGDMTPGSLKAALSDSAHDILQYRIAQAFGGFTAWDGRGVWIAPNGELFDEPVRIYETAADASRWEEFKAIACAAGVLMKEQAVYVACGVNAEIIDL